jgi:hypothetical protein
MGGPVILDADDGLGRLGRLVEMLRAAGGEGWALWAVSLGTRVEARGVALLNSVTQGAGETRSPDLAELLAHPVARAGLAVALYAAPWRDLPEHGPPDLVLDEHAAWMVAVWACARGVPVVVGASAPDGRLTLPLTARGRAWLVQEALQWVPATAHTCDLARRVLGAEARS